MCGLYFASYEENIWLSTTIEYPRVNCLVIKSVECHTQLNFNCKFKSILVQILLPYFFKFKIIDANAHKCTYGSRLFRLLHL